MVLATFECELLLVSVLLLLQQALHELLPVHLFGVVKVRHGRFGCLFGANSRCFIYHFLSVKTDFNCTGEGLLLRLVFRPDGAFSRFRIRLLGSDLLELNLGPLSQAREEAAI